MKEMMMNNIRALLSKKKLEYAQVPMDPRGGDQLESLQPFETFVVNARWRSTWVTV